MKFRGALYLFPSKTDAIDFSKSRISNLIDENPDTIGKWLKSTDSAGLKKVWNSYLYIRGMQSSVGLKTIPVDLVVFDELDEAKQSSVDMAMERMGHSEHRLVLMLSNPTLPDYGIDKAFQFTDQNYWLLKCPACNHYTNMVDTFPDCLKEVGNGVIRACERCGAELNPSVGEWVPKHPTVKEKRGYQYSQLFSYYVRPCDILHQFRTTDNLQDFFNLKIGVAYVEAENRLTLEEVYALCSDVPNADSDPGPSFMGVDQGKDLHVVIGRPDPTVSCRVVHVGVYKDWEDLNLLMNRFHVARCVVDALPETRNARAFAKEFRGRVFLSFYNKHQKGMYAWNEKNLIVQSNRTESMDASHGKIRKGMIVLPRRCNVIEEFSIHLHNVAKKLVEEDEEGNVRKKKKPGTGSKYYEYVKLGPDHFRHALNYMVMAGGFVADSAFAGADMD